MFHVCQQPSSVSAAGPEESLSNEAADSTQLSHGQADPPAA